MDTVKASKVKGDADQFMVADASVSQDDLVGNDGADTAADQGRFRENDGVTSARRLSLKLDFVVAVSWMEVNHGGYGGTTSDAMVWDTGSILKPSLFFFLSDNH